MWYVEFAKKAVKDAEKLKAAGLEDKAMALADVVESNPFATSPAYETLNGNLSGFYSRRINRQHRFVYQVDKEPREEGGRMYEGTVKVVRMWTHYDSVR